MRPLDPVAPDVLADLMLASALAGHAEVVAMCSGAEHCAVMLETGGKMFAGLWVPVEVGEAVAARLSSAAGIALRLGGGDARGDVVRLAVRAGGRTGLVVLSMGMPGEGSRVEIRRLASYGGHVTALKRCTRCGAFQPPQRVACDTDGAPLADVAEDPVVGGTIGAYCVGALLGAGQMGAVFAAEHAIIGRPVAIKVLHRSLARNPVIARRFLGEARAASRLRHGNVVEVTDFGLLRDARPFLVMERIAGEPLDRRLEATARSCRASRCWSRARSHRPSTRRTPRASCTTTSSRRTS